MTTQYVQVNVGRNVGTDPMPEQVWHAFLWDVTSDLTASVRGTFDNPFQLHEGTGAWIDADGQRIEEDSAHVSIIADIDAYALRLALAATAKRYGQDAIALILGSELVSS